MQKGEENIHEKGFNYTGKTSNMSDKGLLARKSEEKRVLCLNAELLSRVIVCMLSVMIFWTDILQEIWG